ncbi:hypothetical protein CLV33_101163 [Jejuia pallidilutea]|uniref:Uncharacterized protein n=1 Tax=Jejuia pallidilutea TaxID=504487 RepID=A0A362XAK0_9FLAO|nr:hypothetical protein CLV33_101163 [Jejuia pallidilutea]
MNRKLGYTIISFITIGSFIISCKQEKDNSELSKNIPTEM